MQAGGDGPANPDMPAMDGGRHIVGMEAWRSVHVPEASGDAEGPELRGTNHRKGHGSGPYRPAQAGHLNRGTVSCPGRSSVETERSEDVHGHPTGRKGSRERGGVCEEEMSDEPLTNFGQELTAFVRPSYPLPQGER